MKRKKKYLVYYSLANWNYRYHVYATSRREAKSIVSEHNSLHDFRWHLRARPARSDDRAHPMFLDIPGNQPDSERYQDCGHGR